MRRKFVAIALTLGFAAGIVITKTEPSQAYVGSALGIARTWAATMLRAPIAALGASQGAQQAASVSTDKVDYAPGETAVISGSGFAAGESVTLQVAHVTGETEGGAGHESWTVAADDTGAFASSWYVNPDDSVGATLLLTAVGASGASAEWTFTDGKEDPEPLADQTSAGAPSGDGIQPVAWSGNPTCGQISAGLFQSKKDMAPSGYHGTYTVVEGGVSVTFTVTASPLGDLIDWTSTLGMTSVFVKGGDGGNLYSYPAEDYGDTGLHAPIGSSDNYSGLSHISFCWDKDLTVKKDAATSFDRTHTWTIDKSGDNTFNKFIGDAASTNNYSVAVDHNVVDSNFAVGGSITIYNDTPDAASITSVADLISPAIGGTVSCPGGLPQALASGATLVCTYSATLPDPATRTNTATVTTEGDVAGGSGEATVDFGGAAVTIYGYPSIDVTDTNGGLGSAAGDNTWNYTKDFSCPTDLSAYTGGKHSFAFDNTATITQTGDSDSAKVTVNCYAPTVSKDAATSYNRDHKWTIEKSASPDALSGFIGGGAGSTTWTIAVTETETESGFTVSGTITVNNPNPEAVMHVAVADSLPGASLDCGGALPVPAGGSATCGYSAGTAKEDGVNTATVTLNNIGFGASADYSFANATVTVTGEPVIHVSDSNGQGSEEFSSDGHFAYPQAFSCSSHAGEYDGGVLSRIVNNVATIEETGVRDDATVAITCYAPSIAKTAATSYTRRHDWTIAKSVTTQSSFTGFPGQSFDFGYSVAVDETESEFDFKVSGAITVANPHPSAPMSVSVTDPGATLDCGGGLTVPANSSASCTYVRPLETKVDGENTATASINHVNFTASASYAFGDPTTVIGPPVVTVIDTQATLGSTDGDYTWAYSLNHGCSTSAGDYSNGVDNDAYPNIATIVETGDDDNENVTVTCYIPAKANVIKTTDEGSQDFGDAGFTFALKLGGSDIETASTNGAGQVMFGTDLTTEGSYSVVELLPTGWYNSSLVCNFDVDYPASAGTVVDCKFHNKEAGRATVLKLTDGAVDPNMVWKFAIFAGAHDECGTPTGGANCASFLGSPIASDTTANSLSGLLEFANTNLEPGVSYTMCETNVAAGWSSLWMVDANRDGIFDQLTEILTPYNPNASALPNPQDVGNRCVTFTPAAGEITAFQVDNQHPGGDPRTIGYWRNWTACAAGNGNQVEVAAKNGGPDAGWYLMENLLPQLIGDLNVVSCTQGVPIVSKQSLDGKQRANDGAYELAAQFLAARLNLAAGAESCVAVQQAVLDAQSLLDLINFTGVGGYLPSSVKNPTQVAQRQLSLSIAKTLDIYNNGNLCTP